MKQVLFVAAENAALPGGKVGGIGDVVRDLPVALADEGWFTTVLTPAYGFLHELPEASEIQSLTVNFAGNNERVQFYVVPGGDQRVRHVVAEHPLFSPLGPGKIYCDDGPHRPFASDAHKFAFFCATVATYLMQPSTRAFDVVHLHDWHAALLLLLRQYAPEFRMLRELRCVYTIHNLALQGIRPLSGDPSALESWYPGLAYERAVVEDPRYDDCINPMALAIRLADCVNTVSPTYAEEIRLPDDPATGFYGGEGLEQDTQAAAKADRLVGILNGCMYPAGKKTRGWQPLARALRSLPATLAVAPAVETILRRFRRRRPRTIVTSVGRITAQKVSLLLESVADDGSDYTALDAVLERLGDDSLFILLGSGDPELEHKLAAVMARHENALFVNGYHETLADRLYACGDLFLMPSSFEPCGISQLLAMRAGQPCVVHGVGGLRDTVNDGETGFVFAGATPAAQAREFVKACDTALTLREAQPARWRSITRAAAAARFCWGTAARAYIRDLYNDGTEPDHAARN